MAIEIFDKGICIAAAFVRFDADEGANGTYYLSGQGVSAIESEGSGTGTCTITLTEELPPLITDLNPAEDTVYLQVVHGVMNKNAPLPGQMCVVNFIQLEGNRIMCQGFAGEDGAPFDQSFWIFVFRVPCPFVAQAEVPGGV